MEEIKVSFKADNYSINEEILGLALREWNDEEIGKTILYIYVDGDAIDDEILRNCDYVITSSSIRFEKPKIYVAEAEKIATGSVLSININGRIRVVFNPHSNNNALFITDACNNYCLMCPQPPKPDFRDNTLHLLEIIRHIRLCDEPSSIGITGGEPTLLKAGLVEIIKEISNKFENTIIQLLTNGRLFSYQDFSLEIHDAAKGKLFVGIPLFGATAEQHNYIVQSKNAFQQTISGIYECRRVGIDVEIRLVLQKFTIENLDLITDFIIRNTPFACHIAFMGMENMGLAKLNFDELWVEPYFYKKILKRNILKLSLLGMNVSIFNLPFCLVDKDVWDFVRDSISDYKQSYKQECNDCSLNDKCGGFFVSSTDKFPLSEHIKPITDNRMIETTTL